MSAAQKLNEALAAHRDNKMAEAEKLYRDVLALDPRHADACALLGVVVGARGDMVEAVQLVNKAVSLGPQSGLLLFHQGTVLMAAKKLPEAIAAFRRAVEAQPGTAQIHFNFANALRASGDWAAAIAQYREALRLDSAMLDAYNNLALSLVHEEKLDEALNMAMQSVTLSPTYGDGWLTICNVAEKLKDYPAALLAGKRACDLMPGNHYAWFGYGVALNRMNRDPEAVAAYQAALKFAPRRANVWDNLAQTYQSMNRLEEAENAFRKAVDADGQSIEEVDEESNPREIDESEYGSRHWHLALVQLLRGDYVQGFPRYRARFKEIKELTRPDLPFALWKGEDLTGKTILVCDEQGYGDTLMLARFVPMLKARGARVVFSVHKVLEPLLRGWVGADLVVAHKTSLPPCDYYCATFDLPHRLGITLDNLPNDVPYLPCPAPGETALPPAAPGKKRVGVVWGGSPLHLNDGKRSVPLDVFVSLFAAQNVQFYSFNRDLKPGDAQKVPRYAIENLVPRLTDFACAAQLIGQMDLVITVDTATAHLAGGMGKDVWVLLPYAPDWRWLTGRDDSPWYPTARLFRQAVPGDWGGVRDAVGRALAQL
jgi:tetratricopeptide (TPR) repeat protein